MTKIGLNKICLKQIIRQMSKIKILLVVNEPSSGCEYHRQIIPHTHLMRIYPDRYDITTVSQNYIGKSPDERPVRQYRKEMFAQYDIVSFCRHILPVNSADDIIEDANISGTFIHFDIDDYWHLSPNHINHRDSMLNKSADRIIKNLQAADLITTTTPYLASLITKYNKNVKIVPNAIDPEEKQWEIINKLSPYTRFGWVGSICHREDIALMEKGIKKLWVDNTAAGKFQMVLGGFGLGEFVRKPAMRNNGEVFLKVERKAPEHQTHVYFEQVFSDYYTFKHDHPEYFDELMRFDDKLVLNDDKMPYRRLWAVDTYNYGRMYNEWDVTLVPLNRNTFNCSKSQLKIIESGFMGKAVICSGIIPYTYDIIHNQNGMLIAPDDHKAWHRVMRTMINEPQMRQELAVNLSDHVRSRYHIDIVNRQRDEIYRKAAAYILDKIPS